jgi:hypothetical protein
MYKIRLVCLLLLSIVVCALVAFTLFMRPTTERARLQAYVPVWSEGNIALRPVLKHPGNFFCSPFLKGPWS